MTPRGRWIAMHWQCIAAAALGLFLLALFVHYSVSDGKLSASEWIVLKINHAYFRYKLSRHHYIHESDFPKLSLPLPLANDSVQLVAFATTVNSNLCLSMETALLSGWKYQLFGPTLGQHFSKKLHRGTSYLEKLAVLQALAEGLSPDSVILWADAYDVIYQGDARDFLPRYRNLLAQRGVQGSAEGNLTVFNAEQKCSPYKNLG
eukprot:gene34396-46138_t